MTWEGLNRRCFPRANYPCLLKIRKEGEDGQIFLTHTENISVGGVCVIIQKHFEIFSMVGLEIDLMDGDETISCRGKVVWTVRRKATEKEKPSFYDTGIEFIDLKGQDRARLEAVIDILVKGELRSTVG